MNCREFEESWNEILDARSERLADLERALDAHATTCEPCQAVAARYRLLRQAIAAWAPTPALTADSWQRLRRLSAGSTRRRSRFARRLRIVLPLVAAAALLWLVWLDDAWPIKRPGPIEADAPVVAHVEPPRPIESTLERATSATIGLAIEASGPAARIGRDVLTFDEPTTSTEVSTTEADSAADVAASASGMLQTVGERVKPISGSARHAFRFLLGPPPGPEPATAPRDSF